MSDFWGDDFTAELKDYFLNQLLAEILKYREAIDEDSWPVFRDEIAEKSKDWMVDARTNEFTYFAHWFENACVISQEQEGVDFCFSFLEQAEAYLRKLLVTKKDAEDLPTQFAIAMPQGRAQLYLHCQIGTQEILLPVHAVLEVIGAKKVSPLPYPVGGVSGLVAYRGEAIPVFVFEDMENADEAKQNYVICEVERQQFALQVQRVDRLFEVKNQDLQAKETGHGLFADDFVSHFMTHENKTLFILDLQKMAAA